MRWKPLATLSSSIWTRACLAALALAVATPVAHADAMSDCQEPWPYENIPLKQVIKGCTKLIEAGEENVELLAALYYKRGLSYYDAKDFKASIRDLDEAIRLKPDYPYALCTRGSSYEELGMLNEALADYEASVRLEPSEGCAAAAKRVRAALD
ncbi:MAG: tetratricopeptide repeat protein [Tabrizicola sp.]|nr:tetratricopeptide repeat protein [Tabrizicola sp.]